MKTPLQTLVPIALLVLAGTHDAQGVLVVDPAGPYTTIQSAIVAALPGDTVLVSPGTYVEHIDFLGKDIAVLAAGSGGPATHVIDVQGAPGPVVTFAAGEGRGARLEGFTVTGGSGSTYSAGVGGVAGILISGGASPSIRGCHIERNLGGSASHPGSGAGMAIHGGAPRLERCEFRENVGGSAGISGYGSAGGLFIDDAHVELVDCTFDKNVGSGGFQMSFSPPDDSGAGAIWLRRGSLEATGCTFAENVGVDPFDNGLGWGAPGAVRIGRVDYPGGYADYAEALLVDCEFRRNTEGVLFVDNMLQFGRVRAERCTFVGNSSGDTVLGKGESYSYLPLELHECVFLGNSGGSAVRTGDDSYTGGPSVRLTGCVVAEHSDVPSYSWVLMGYGSSVSVWNSIVWGNSQPLALGSDFRNSCFEGGAGSGNIGSDPAFRVPPAAGPDGIWGTDDDVGDLRLSSGSPCIDAGSSPLAQVGSIGADLDGNLRFRDDPATPDTGTSGGLGGSAVVDMGAYEYGSAPSPWADEGPAGRRAWWTGTNASGSNYTILGRASLSAHGGLTSGEDTSVRVETPGLEAGRLCILVVSRRALGTPLLGGTLVPSHELLVKLRTDGSGAAQIDFPWPANLSSGTTLHVQAWCDPGGGAAFVPTRALTAVVP